MIQKKRKAEVMKWPSLKKNRFNKKKEVSHENVICKNCETQFSGHFCPGCGQSVKEFDKPFSFVIYNFAGDFFLLIPDSLKRFSIYYFIPVNLQLIFLKVKELDMLLLSEFLYS